MPHKPPKLTPAQAARMAAHEALLKLAKDYPDKSAFASALCLFACRNAAVAGLTFEQFTALMRPLFADCVGGIKEMRRVNEEYGNG